MLECNKQRLQDKITTFSKFGDTGIGGISRLSLSPAALQARQEFSRRCKALGMEVKTDDLANLYGVLAGNENLPAIAMGSHLDSVPNGGNFDGTLGVLGGLEVAETLVNAKYTTRHPVVVMVWTNEEGARFDPAMMCSGIVAGKFEQDKMLASTDVEGTTFGQALAASGCQGESANRLSAANTAAYLELHIEQGPVLEAAHKEIGVVEGVVGMVNYEITLTGVSNHAGTTPQHTRKDALYAASQVITRLWKTLGNIDPALVFTVGRLNLLPNIHTVIPRQVQFTLDARHQSPAVLQRVVEIIDALPAAIAGCQLSHRQLWARDTVPFAPSLTQLVENATVQLGYSSLRMYSGAGHDAQYIASMVPTTMLFVPSTGGHSHCVEEHTSTEAALKGANVLLHTLLALDDAQRLTI